MTTDQDAEAGRYLRRVFASPPAAVALTTQFLELPERHRALTVLILAVEDLARVQDAITVAAVALSPDCAGCPHASHPDDECLVAYVERDGTESACGCGSVSLRVVREVLRETAAETLEADRRVEYGDDERRDDQAEREAHHG